MKKDFEGSSNGGFEDGNSPEIHCSEAEWTHFIAWSDHEVGRFRRFYETLKVRPDEDRLDKCALAMGWQLDGDEAETRDELIKMFGADFTVTPPPGPPPVYSLLNTTEVVAIRAIVDSLQARICSIFSIGKKMTVLFPSEKMLALAAGFSRAEQAMMLAIDALSARENTLATALMKRAHGAWNHYLGLLAELGNALDSAEAEKTQHAHYSALREGIFDLRELCLRIIRDAREAERESAEDEGDI